LEAGRPPAAKKTSFELGEGALHCRIALPLGKAARIV
jgi:hypothetical protein